MVQQPAIESKCYPGFYPETATFIFLPNFVFYSSLIQLVGTIGFEPTTPCPPDKCATKLRYAPTV